MILEEDHPRVGGGSMDGVQLFVSRFSFDGLCRNIFRGNRQIELYKGKNSLNPNLSCYLTFKINLLNIRKAYKQKIIHTEYIYFASRKSTFQIPVT